MTIPVLIDCDPGHDDAIALLLAVASSELQVLAVTTVAGNTTLDKTTANALRVLEKAGRSEIPVAPGSDRPLTRQLRVAEHVHGSSGLDGPQLEPPRTAPAADDAVELMAEILRSHDDPITVITLGPLTKPGSAGLHPPSRHPANRAGGVDGWLDRARQRHPGRRVQHLRRS